MVDWNLKYGELANDKDFVDKCENLKESLIEMQKVLDKLLPLKDQYDKLTLPAKIELDLVLAYMLNAFQWVNLRISGVDPTEHPIKHELQRIKAMMLRWQQIKDRDKRQKVDIEAAERFVRSALYDPNQKENKYPPNKKIKFDVSDD